MDAVGIQDPFRSTVLSLSISLRYNYITILYYIYNCFLELSFRMLSLNIIVQDFQMAITVAHTVQRIEVMNSKTIYNILCNPKILHISTSKDLYEFQGHL